MILKSLVRPRKAKKVRFLTEIGYRKGDWQQRVGNMAAEINVGLSAAMAVAKKGTSRMLRWLEIRRIEQEPPNKLTLQYPHASIEFGFYYVASFDLRA